MALRLMYLDETWPARSGLMLVQLLDATHLKVEVFPGSTAEDAAFTGAALIYVR